MRIAPRNEIEGLEAELELLPKLTAKQLDERWRERFETVRPPRLYRPLLIGVLAYRIQEKAFGDLKPATRRLLRHVAGLPAERRALVRLTQPRLKVFPAEGHPTVHEFSLAELGAIVEEAAARSTYVMAHVYTDEGRPAMSAMRSAFH